MENETIVLTGVKNFGLMKGTCSLNEVVRVMAEGLKVKCK